jgi:hypothetical protein
MSMSQELSNFIAEKNILINGIESMPELGLTNVIYENPWDAEDDSLYVAGGMKLTMSKTSDGMVHALNKVSKTYKLVQHDEALLGSLKAIYDGMPDFGTPKIDVSFRDNGGRMMAKIKSEHGIEIAEKDVVYPQLVLSNSADLSKRFTLAFGVFRFVCSNGLVIPDHRFPDCVKIKKLHKEGTLNLESILASMVQVGQGINSAVLTWNEYTKKAIAKVEMENVVDGILSPTQFKNILELDIRGGEGNLETVFKNGSTSVWNAYNAVTQFLTDNNKNDDTTLERGRRISERFDELVGITVH